jgi:hypothetical protein
MMGCWLAFCMIGTLNIYYMCTLSFNVREEVFRRCVEPVLYYISITASVIGPTVVLLKADMFNPTVNDPLCGPAIYPERCNKEDDPDCRGTPCGSRNFLLTFMFALTLGFGTLIITMGSVIYTFCKREKRVKEKLQSSTETTDEDESKARELKHGKNDEDHNQASVNLHRSLCDHLDNADARRGRSNRSLVLGPSPENDFSTMTWVLFQHVDFLSS